MVLEPIQDNPEHTYRAICTEEGCDWTYASKDANYGARLAEARAVAHATTEGHGCDVRVDIVNLLVQRIPPRPRTDEVDP